MIQIPMTRPEFTAAAARVKQQAGVAIASDTGQIEHGGVTVAYGFDGSELSLNVLHKPFFLSESAIENGIRGWFSATA